MRKHRLKFSSLGGGDARALKGSVALIF